VSKGQKSKSQRERDVTYQQCKHRKSGTDRLTDFKLGEKKIPVWNATCVQRERELWQIFDLAVKKKLQTSSDRQSIALF